MHILFTRPLEDSKEIISRFQNLGHKVSHLPVLNIKEKKHEKINFSNYSAVIFTSANSLKYLKSNDIDKNIICFSPHMSCNTSACKCCTLSYTFIIKSTAWI